MRVAFRRTWLGLRVFALIGVGGFVAHLAAVSIAPREHDAQAAAPSEKPSPSPAASAATSADIPLPGANMDRDQRLAAKGMRAGNPVMIRIFKAESQLEVWLQKEDRFELFAAYPICYWSGRLGPKTFEGDKQAPEGLYSVGIGQIYHKGRWPRSLDIGFPNTFDRIYARTGSLILVHGGCKSTGCYAMTNPVMDEIYGLSEQALRQGQDAIPVHIFPFRMTEENMVAQAGNPWMPFWLNLKVAYDFFERTRVPPRVSVCNKRYSVADSDTASGPCVDDGAGGIPMPSLEADAASTKVIKTRKVASKAASKVASKAHTRRAAGGRNARKAYAEARRARIAEQARRMRTSDASPRRRPH